MGRITEIISFLNSKELPSTECFKVMYTRIEKTDRLIEIRKMLRDNEPIINPLQLTMF